MRRIICATLLPALLQTYAAAPATTQSGDSVPQAESTLCAGYSAVCDIYTRRGARIRTMCRVQQTAHDTIRVVCIDELGIALVSGFFDASAVTLERNWPPVNRRRARNVLVAAGLLLVLCPMVSESPSALPPDLHLPPYQLSHLGCPASGTCSLTMHQGARLRYYARYDSERLTLLSRCHDTLTVLMNVRRENAQKLPNGTIAAPPPAGPPSGHPHNNE